MIIEILVALLLVFLAWEMTHEFRFSLSFIEAILSIPSTILSIIRELTWRDLLRLVISVVIILIVWRNKEITALSVSIILLLSIIIPERHKLTERAWEAFSPAIDSAPFFPDSDDLATRFSSSMQTFRDAWKGFRRSLLSVVGLLMVVLVIDISLLAEHIAQEHQQETLKILQVWPPLLKLLPQQMQVLV